MTLVDDVRTAEAAVQDLIDLEVATRDPSLSPPLRKRLTEMRQRREREVPGVRVSVAAKLLQLSEHTVREWTRSGALDSVPEAKPARVTTSSLARALPVVTRLREIGRDRELLLEVVDHLEDDRIRSLRRVKRSLEQAGQGEYEFVSSAEL